MTVEKLATVAGFATVDTVVALLDVVVVTLTLLVIVGRRKSAHVTLAWILVVVTFPFVGPLLWFLLAGRRIRRVGRRKRLSAEAVRARLATLFGSRGSVLPADASVLALAGRLTGLPATAGNRLELLTENDEAFRRKLDAIGAARRSVWAEYYLVEPDETGKGFLRLLAAKAREGLDVRLLYDAVGASRIDDAALDELLASGGRAHAFLPVNPFRRRWSTHLRNHRKLLVVDAAKAFTGGMNVGNEYSGLLARLRPGSRASREAGKAWRDTHVLVEGPAVHELVRVFAEDWTFQTGEHLDVPAPVPAPAGPLSPRAAAAPGTPGPVVSVLPSGPDQAENATALAWFAAIGLSRQRCWITSPYFVPDEPTQRALVSAALRGVDVRLLVPLESDAPLVSWAAYSFFPPLLSAGVRIWRYAPAVLHAKTTAVDGSLSLVGSANLDVRSFLLNFELGVLVRDPDFASALEARFLADIAVSEEVTLKWWYAHGPLWRLLTNVSRLLSPIL